MFMGPVTLVRCDYTNPNQKICGSLFWQISILTLCISRSQPKWSNSKIAGRRFSSDPVFWYTWNSETYSVAIFRKDCALSVCWSLNKFWKILILILFWAFYEKCLACWQEVTPPFLRLRSEVRAGTVRKYGKKICRNEIAKGIPVDLEWCQEFKSIPPSLVSASIVADGNWHRIYLHRRSKDTR